MIYHNKAKIIFIEWEEQLELGKADEEKKALSLYEKVLEATRDAKNELKELEKKTKSNDKFDTKADRDDDEGEVYEQFLKNKRRSETSLMKNKSFVKKKKIK